MKTKIKSAVLKGPWILWLMLMPVLAFLASMCTKSVYDLSEDLTPPTEDIRVPVQVNTITPEGIMRYDHEAGNNNETGKEVYFIVEEMPDFQGTGAEGFRQYIADNLRYPQSAAEKGIEGRVFVQFTVNSDGKVSDATIVRGIDPSLDSEALRVVMSSPPWEPGRQKGQAVNVAFTFPLNFVLEKKEENELQSP